ncbi:hypothetical protein A9762_09175 [Pandoraea sp. ISTKB]|nr:hypothetical protein A9762_09175 [Pandoraea sp. ISTKB]
MWSHRLLAGLARLDITSPRATYVLRSIVAAWLALCVAYLLELEMPFSAATTVLLVVNPIQGAVIGKGAWRVLGTLVGIVASFVLMSAFAEMPWLFVLGFATWLGVCVAGMTMLRHFRASGVVVAGYTVGLATFGALTHPHLAFEHVIGRGSTVMVGVVCLSLVTALFSRRGVRGKLDAMLSRLAARAAQTIAADNGEGDAAARAGADDLRRQLIAEIYGVDDLLAVGKAESVDLAHRAHAVRHAMASLFAALTAAPAGNMSRPAPSALRTMLTHAWQDAAQAVGAGPEGLERAAHCLREARAKLHRAMADIASTSPTTLIALDRLIEQIDDYLAALDGLASLHRPRPAGGGVTIRFHRDLRAALQNGVRSALTLFAAGAAWIVTGWPHGDMMLLIVAPYCALLAAAPNPAAGAWQFVKGTLFAVPVAFVCAFYVLPHIEGLLLLLVVLGTFWLPGIYATTLPKHGLAALAYLVGFNTLTAADNPMHYDVPLFLNWSLAWIAGTLLAWLGFRVLLPRVLPKDIARLQRRIRDEALRALWGAASSISTHSAGPGGDVRGRLSSARTSARASARVWQWRQQHRIAQLGALRKAQPEAMRRDVDDALASLHLGREAWRLRMWLLRDEGEDGNDGRAETARMPAAREVVATALARMSRRTRAGRPALAARHARYAARRLAILQAALSLATHEPVPLARLVAALTDIAELLDAHEAYFASPPTGSTHAQ